MDTLWFVTVTVPEDGWAVKPLTFPTVNEYAPLGMPEKTISRLDEQTVPLSETHQTVWQGRPCSSKVTVTGSVGGAQ